MAGSIWSSETFLVSEWFSSFTSLWSVGIKVQFFFGFNFNAVKGVLNKEGGVKAPRMFPLKAGLVRTPSLVWYHTYWHCRSRRNLNRVQRFYRSPAKYIKKKQKKQNTHTPTLFFRPGLLPLPYFSTSSILKCPRALSSLPVPCRQLRPSTKQCNVYS